jgi:hypothetical protein
MRPVLSRHPRLAWRSGTGACHHVNAGLRLSANWQGTSGGRLESNGLFMAPTIVEKVTPAIATAYYDVVTKFLHGETKSSDEAVKQLVVAINSAK